MERDLQLVKEVLRAVEKQKGLNFISSDQLEIEEWSLDEINYNIVLMGNAGLLEIERMEFMGGGLEIIIHSMTWNGHDFLDAARNDTVWNKVEKMCKNRVVS